ncbi:MAG: rhomboid family intramembrane serine protease [Ardenticatenaceae bacterium]|nr:rhomboid family intramembrane serine protease [Ardenticatenaceae bacterium]MCB9443094.1 rhomboid family intramembrane serine protease [Ardenticatenaceae bacterium]
MTSNNTVRALQSKLKVQAAILGGFVAFIWLLELVDQLIFHGWLDHFGVWPRTAVGLWGILLAPVLHAGFGHVMANTIPFIVLGWFVMMRRLRDFFIVSAITVIVSGLGIWLIAPANTVHLGASGLIFGYFGYLLLRGYFERSLSSIFWSVLVLFLYGGMIWGVLPQQLGISWQSHLFGFIGGGLAAYWLTQRGTAVTTPVDTSPIIIDINDFD